MADWVDLIKPITAKPVSWGDVKEILCLEGELNPHLLHSGLTITLPWLTDTTTVPTPVNAAPCLRAQISVLTTTSLLLDYDVQPNLFFRKLQKLKTIRLCNFNVCKYVFNGVLGGIWGGRIALCLFILI